MQIIFILFNFQSLDLLSESSDTPHVDLPNVDLLSESSDTLHVDLPNVDLLSESSDTPHVDLPNVESPKTCKYEKTYTI